MKTTHALFAVLAFTGIAITGCTKDVTAPENEQAPAGVTNEIEAMKLMASQDEFVQNDEQTFEDREIEPMETGTFGKIEAEITPLRFGRFITSVTRTITVTVAPGDSIAVAHVRKDIEGIFKIKGINGVGDTVLVEKPFEDRATRNVIFKRINRDNARFWRNWFPVATSLVDGGTISNSPSQIDLTKLQMFLPNGDTVTVTDPNSFYLRYRWLRLFDGGRKDIPELRGGDRVILQATLASASPDTDIVALRLGYGPGNHRRTRMELVSEFDNGDGTFTRVYQKAWFCHFHTGFFHAGVVAVTKETLFDDAAPYAASWWGIPYRVF